MLEHRNFQREPVVESGSSALCAMVALELAVEEAQLAQLQGLPLRCEPCVAKGVPVFLSWKV